MNKQTSFVVVTGAASGIGAAISQQLMAVPGQHLILLDRQAETLARLAATAPETCSVQTLAVDLSDTTQLSTILLPLLADKPVHQLVISHGIADENQLDESAIWDKVLLTNLTSVQRLLAVLEPKLAQGASVVIVSSILGLIGKKTNSAYCASKHGLLGLVKAAALDLAARRIRVNAVLPSWVDTPMLQREVQRQADMTGIAQSDMLRRIKKRIPLRSLVQADDVAHAIQFLLSAQSRMITAQSIVIDGGDGCGL
jgi:NAD(P)-dependent dehydrogenase (short-subunit alcohol dehydrogenase family)